ncbi:MAG: PDZ domain-containing protein [Bacteroidetes bacterium]|nr:PDZ domain-containing protein [Bacteroidota bacterium]
MQNFSAIADDGLTMRQQQVVEVTVQQASVGLLERHLGILGLELNDELLSLLPPVRTKNGVLVAALVGKVSSWEGDLRTGDIIISVNNVPMYDFESLKKYTDEMSTGHICVVHVERAGQYKYVTLEID